MREYKAGDILRAEDINKLLQSAHRQQVKVSAEPPIEVTSTGGGWHLRFNDVLGFFAQITYQDPITLGCTWQEMVPIADGQFAAGPTARYGYSDDNPAFPLSQTEITFPAYVRMWPGYTWDDGEQEYLFMPSGDLTCVGPFVTGVMCVNGQLQVTTKYLYVPSGSYLSDTPCPSSSSSSSSSSAGGG